MTVHCKWCHFQAWSMSGWVVGTNSDWHSWNILQPLMEICAGDESSVLKYAKYCSILSAESHSRMFEPNASKNRIYNGLLISFKKKRSILKLLMSVCLGKRLKEFAIYESNLCFVLFVDQPDPEGQGYCQAGFSLEFTQVILKCILFILYFTIKTKCNWFHKWYTIWPWR